MQAFADLYRALDETTSTNRKVAAMVEYFRTADPDDAAWAVYFLAGKRLKRLIRTSSLRLWVAQLTGYPDWLVETSYQHVGDLAETLALLVDEPSGAPEELSLHEWVETRILPLRKLDEELQAERIKAWWQSLPAQPRFVLNKLLTGALRVGVSRRLVTRALAEVGGIPSAIVAHRFMGDWQPSAESFLALIDPDVENTDQRLPYPFFLASPLEAEVESLGDVSDWAAEWKWDGIRAQLIRRSGTTAIWSRGEDLLDGRFPEIEAAAKHLPDGVVIDGEILAWRGDGPLPFNVLQQRIGRKKVGPTTLRKAPTLMLAYDLLEWEGEDRRAEAWQIRRGRLEDLLDELPEAASSGLRIEPLVAGKDWAELAEKREQSRDLGVEGLMLKRRDSAYETGRVRGTWWKWKVDPYTADAVLLYAQPGHGRRANLLTDYTFAVWDSDDKLVPFAKAYSGLDNKEIDELDRWIRRNTKERFGPVRSVNAELVFELAFEGINRSSRHKSGIAVRFPRIHRWRRDLGIEDADRLEDIRRLLPDETG